MKIIHVIFCQIQFLAKLSTSTSIGLSMIFFLLFPNRIENNNFSELSQGNSMHTMITAETKQLNTSTDKK